MGGDAGEDVGQPGLRIDTTTPLILAVTVHGRGASATASADIVDDNNVTRLERIAPAKLSITHNF